MTRMLAISREVACFALAATMLCASAPVAQTEADHAAIARAALTEVIRPGYAAFGEATSALSGKVDTLCKEPSDVALKEARNAFATTVDAWSKVEIFRFGPINEDHRFDRLFYWPDPKSIGLKQVQDALAHRDPQIEDEASFRCSFANSVATNVDRIAKNVIEGWREGSAYEAIGGRSRLSRPQGSHARTLQGVCHWHRARPRPEACQGARLIAFRGEAEACAILAKRPNLFRI